MSSDKKSKGRFWGIKKESLQKGGKLALDVAADLTPGAGAIKAVLTGAEGASILKDITYDLLGKDSEAWKRALDRDVPTLEAKAKEGELSAITGLAIRYYEGEGVDKDVNKAKELLNQAAEAGYGQAQLWLGWHYYSHADQDITDKNEQDKLAFTWLEKAYAQHEMQSATTLGQMYFFNRVPHLADEKNRGVFSIHEKHNNERAFELFEDAVLSGERSSYPFFASFCIDGGIPDGYDRKKYLNIAMGLLVRSIEDHLPGSYFLMARIFMDRIYPEPLSDEEYQRLKIKYLTLGAKAGQADCQTLLGLELCTQSDKAETAQKKAELLAQGEEWLKQASNKGKAEAQRILGHLYMRRDIEVSDYTQSFKQFFNYVVKPLGLGFRDATEKKSFELMEKSAISGDGMAQYILGWMYCDGMGCVKDYAKAVHWYQLSAEQGVDVAQHNLGILYFMGIGIPQDKKRAFEWTVKAAEQGLAQAEVNMGVFYNQGVEGVVEKDDIKAFEWTEKAALKGDARAQSSLAAYYYNGIGVEQNYDKAVEWAQKSADQNEAGGLHNLGYAYYMGHGVDADMGKARELMTRAADLENELAIEWLKNNQAPKSKVAPRQP